MHVRTELLCLVLLLVLALAGCAAPILTPDGQLVFAEKGGTRGASVLTAHGILFLDRSDVPPQPIARRRADEPWSAPTGFLLPADGVWRETSTPTALSGRGLLVMVRPSDVLVPSWGGEVLIRIDAIVPPDAFPDAREASLRKPLDVVLVLEGRGGDLEAMIEAATDGLGQRDRIAVVRADPPRLVVPWLPGTHRTLVRAAASLAAQQPKAARAAGDIERALAMASETRRRASPRSRAIYLSSGVPTAPRSAEARRLGLEVPQGTTLEERAAWLADAVPPPGEVVLHDVALTIASNPAPARIIEPSGGDPSLALDHDQLYLGDMYVGEARTEVVRVALPVWVPGKPLELSVSATYSLADGRPLRTVESISMRFSSDVEALASKRHGDVIAYASALAMVRRLDRAFLRGSATEPSETADLRTMALWQARSLRDLAKLRGDRALATQAEILTALVGSMDR
jgi:hypothetical protein